ncbi:MAG: hypothetical protein J6S11_07425 [Bacteroidaceae bacterium]|nr:hypothetical protein [Bacteroidaceae bacterium]
MKKIILCIIAACSAMAMQAQEIDWKGLTRFADELESLQGEHVSCDTMTYREFLDYLGTLIVGDADELFSQMDKEDFQFINISSPDGIGRESIYKVLDKYEVTTAEMLFGIPLLLCNRSNSDLVDLVVLFVGDQASLMVLDYGDSIEVLLLNSDLMEIVKEIFTSKMTNGDEVKISIGSSGELQFSYSFSRTSEHVETERGECREPKVYSFDQQSSGTDPYERFDEEVAQLAAQTEERLNREQQAQLDEQIKLLKKPSFVQIPGTEDYLLGIPELSDEPSHVVYDWVNELGFGKGVVKDNPHQKSEIILPEDVARLYAVTYLPQEKWNEEGYSPMLKAIYQKEYQGGTPAVLYRFSKSEAGYKDMLADLGFLFKLELGDTYRNLKVTQQSERNGKRFVQLYGEGGILMCVFDSPADHYCHMSILVGGGGGFEQAVNEYVFGGERDIATRCNIIINSDMSGDSCGIHFTTDEYFFAGKSHKNGVHIDFRYWDLYTK